MIDVVKGWIDGVEGTNAQNLPVRHREILLEQVTDWFNEHIPASYTTPLNTDDYQTIQKIKHYKRRLFHRKVRGKCLKCNELKVPLVTML